MLHAAVNGKLRPAGPVFLTEADWSSLAADMLAGARRTLESDPGVARQLLDRLSVMIEGMEAGAGIEPALVPDRPCRPTLAAAKGGLAVWQQRRVMDLIEERLDETLVIETLAEAARLSTGHFCRAFKVSIGETPHAFLIRQRVRRAQTLMLHTNESLSRIAFACGLTDQAHLSRLFRRMVGDTPLAWRRSWRTAR